MINAGTICLILAAAVVFGACVMPGNGFRVSLRQNKAALSVLVIAVILGGYPGFSTVGKRKAGPGANGAGI